ncbi:uncharacterized protein V1518DRAFT_411329 [Limtongia smithiae]|uniref:uncharacterized protein n=1 Tax=Limtongia smithiae TaxID=1125753 RepID=UPI0034CEC80B
MASTTAPSLPRPSSTRRTRVVISCTECHRRKQKCDRKQPCNQCIARKVESLCHYATRQPPPASSPTAARPQPFATSAKLGAVSAALQAKAAALSSLKSPASTVSISSSNPFSAPAAYQHEYPAELPPLQSAAPPGVAAPPATTTADTALSHKASSTSSCDSPSPNAVVHTASSTTTTEYSSPTTADGLSPKQPQIHDMRPPALSGSISSSDDERRRMDYTSDEESESAFDHSDDDDEDYDVVDVLGYFKSGVSNIARDIAELKLSPKFISSADFYTAGGEWKPKKPTSSRNAKVVARILRTMPPRPYVELLIKIFFCEANFYQSTNELQFWDSLNKWWRSENRTDNVGMAALIFRLMSIALQFVPEEHLATVRQIDYSLESLSNDYSQCASELAALLPDCVDKVLESMMKAAWLKYEARMKDSWYCVATTVRMAQEIKLHIEEPDCPPTYERERRRRLWWTIYYWDRCMGLILGRPIMISDDICNVPLPLDLADDAFFPEVVIPKNPPITMFTGRLLSFKLLQFMADLDSNPQRLFRNLTIFTASLPPYFSIHAPDTTLYDRLPFLIGHRESLATTICMILCALYRRKIDIPNPLSFCLRLLTAADRILGMSRDHQYRQFMIVYSNLEPSVLICREILKMSGRLAEAAFVVSSDRNGNTIDVFMCLKAVDGALQRMKLVRNKNKIAVKAYRILKELVRRVKIQVEREKTRYVQLRSVQAMPADTQAEMYGSRSIPAVSAAAASPAVSTSSGASIQTPFNLSASPNTVMVNSAVEGTMSTMPQVINMTDLEDTILDDSMLRILQGLSSQGADVQQLDDLALGQLASVRPDLICGKVPIVMPIPPSIHDGGNHSIAGFQSAPIPDGASAGSSTEQEQLQENLMQIDLSEFERMDMDDEVMFSWAEEVPEDFEMPSNVSVSVNQNYGVYV